MKYNEGTTEKYRSEILSQKNQKFKQIIEC